MWFFQILMCVSLATVLVQAASAQLSTEQMRVCTRVANEEERSRCEAEISRALTAAGRSTDLGAGWTLARSQTRGGENNLAVMRVGDTTRSDPDFGGLSFRCGRQGIETTLILLATLPGEARGTVKVNVKSTAGEHEFDASLSNGGRIVVLPPTASELAAGDWGRAADLSIRIDTGTAAGVKGVVPARGLTQALNALRAGCLAGKP